ncbi:cytochrome P450 Tp4149-like [Dioscorea cayenensis subsp. rotundata]|uniref:Cytochrome P450 Tp4149-like n=1 Tax=Dioscorea cayennensis subsp. rotundata TaxID=55577 RepID=A0AB40C3G7_DIOCR|nr:cytochrome P450 Tp4149-like [Dioscorea cayenensis subsp. rotundata]
MIVEDEMRDWKGKSEGEGETFIHGLISLIDKDQRKEFTFSKENIKAIIKDVMGAGTESVSVVMDWIMAELLKKPPTNWTSLKN